MHIESSPAIEGDIVVAGAGAIEVGPEHKPKGDPNGRGHPGYVLGARIVEDLNMDGYADLYTISRDEIQENKSKPFVSLCALRRRFGGAG